jgi:hypothetical protein
MTSPTTDLYRERRWTKYLPDGFILQVYLKTDRAQIVSFSVALIKDRECVTRYDNAHGFAHRDVIGRKTAPRVREKERFDSLTLNEVFNYAIQDITENYAKYDEEYRKH